MYRSHTPTARAPHPRQQQKQVEPSFLTWPEHIGKGCLDRLVASVLE